MRVLSTGTGPVRRAPFPHGPTAEVSSTGFDGDVDLPRSRVLSGCGVVVVGLELNGRDKADLAVKAAVIEPVDVPPSMFLQA